VSDYLDRYARKKSLCHRLPGSIKIATAIALILTAISVPLERWPILGVLLVVTYLGLSLAGVPLAYLMRRVGLFLPMMFLLTISLPASQGFERGWDLMGTILLRSTVSLMSVLWLVNTLPFDELLVTLRRGRFPIVLLATLAFMYRFLFVSWDELERLKTARRMRSFGRSSPLFRWKSLSRMIGLLMIRGLTRSERVHGAMCARGWTGEVVFLEDDSDT
jgi:cobalt/nickel transport system permease protein